MCRNDESSARSRPVSALAVPVMALSAGLVLPSRAAAQWVVFDNQTSERLVAEPAFGSADVEEKSYGWGDLDLDGDIDLVVARKQPGLTSGKRSNRLFMNEDGVLVDRTGEYAILSDVPGDMAFHTLTNDRDVLVVDVDLDGWLDVVTAVTSCAAEPKHIGHPRVYRNLGADPDTQDWLGLQFEDGRIPALLTDAGVGGKSPRFAALAAGDVTGDGYPDLWFSDQDIPCAADGCPEPSGSDFNDKLLVNLGAEIPGYFIDATETAVLGAIIIGGQGPFPFNVSVSGVGASIVDMNGDGTNDIVKITACNEPFYLGVAYNAPATQGQFDSASYGAVSVGEPYAISADDLNNDGKLDLVVTEDGIDRYFLNAGNAPNGNATFASTNFPMQTNGFGGQSVIADLNRDGWKDVLISDVDMDLVLCTSTADVLRNNANPPALTFTHDLGNLPGSMLKGVHDFAVFDINGDSWLDLVVGRCTGTQVWIQVPPIVPPDIDGDGMVDGADLGLLLAAWGAPGGDLNGDGTTDGADLGILLGAWTSG